MSLFKRVEMVLRKIREPLFQGVITIPLLGEVSNTMLPGKSSKLQLNRTVPQTDTGAYAEYAQALERTQEKELGKLTP